MAASAENLENFFCDKPTVIVRIIDDDLYGSFAEVTGETKIKSVARSRHNPAFFRVAHTTGLQQHGLGEMEKKRDLRFSSGLKRNCDCEPLTP